MLDDLFALMDQPEAQARPTALNGLAEPAPVAPGQSSMWQDLEDARLRVGLQQRFGVPPFSILDARAGYWQARKAEWLALGIQSELGRGDTMAPEERAFGHGERTDFVSGAMRARGTRGLLSKATEREGFGMTYDTSKGENAWGGSGTSIFDPVICELAYRWFTPGAGAAVLDPFAGGSVRGIVAQVLGHHYTGIDLSGRQLEANREQAARIVPDNEPSWIEGDSRTLDSLLPAREQYDLVFSCPPYFDLEVYGDKPGELSAAGSYDAFLALYGDCIRAALGRLRTDRFVVWVVGEIRDKRGMQRGLVADTIALFREAGAALYNEAVLVTAVGSLPLRAGKAFVAGRKLGRTHQAVLVFWKGRRSPNDVFPRLEVPE